MAYSMQANAFAVKASIRGELRSSSKIHPCSASIRSTTRSRVGTFVTKRVASHGARTRSVQDVVVSDWSMIEIGGELD